jgi:hypothetical protein
MMRTIALEVIMGMYQDIETASANIVDRVMEALVAGLELEFGSGLTRAATSRN